MPVAAKAVAAAELLSIVAFSEGSRAPPVRASARSETGPRAVLLANRSRADTLTERGPDALIIVDLTLVHRLDVFGAFAETAAHDQQLARSRCVMPSGSTRPPARGAYGHRGATGLTRELLRGPLPRAK